METFHKKNQCFAEIRVLTPVQPYQYGIHIFILPKYEESERFITDYKRPNQELVIWMCTLPKKGDNMHQLEVSSYATTLYLNMGDNMIRIFCANQYMTKIVTEFRKFIYNFIPTVMCASGDMFQKNR